jgi:hypothetical protein
MRARSDGEKLARYIHISKELRFTNGILFIFNAIPLVLPIAGAGAAFGTWFYLFLCPQGLNFLSSIVCQYNPIGVPNATRQIHCSGITTISAPLDLASLAKLSAF